MPVSNQSAIEAVRMMLDVRNAEAPHFATLADYYHGRQSAPWLATGIPLEVKRIVDIARVNILKLVVGSLAQSLYVDGYRQPQGADQEPAWRCWQLNKLDARQIAIHRAALTYGASYATVLPGMKGKEETAVITGVSPRRMTTVYADDPDWPVWGLEAHAPVGREQLFTLWGPDALYDVAVTQPQGAETEARFDFIEHRQHDQGVTPIIRFQNEQDLDDEGEGEIEPLTAIQDQINKTTFELLTAQHYGAFRQRWVIGWTDANEEIKLKASVSRLWSFEDENVKVGQFDATSLKDYLESREASIRHAASISQTPAHELLGQIVNISAEALVAAEAAQRRKVTERAASYGESWEQTLELAGQSAGFEVNESAQVRWRDTESRALAATVDALGKMAKMLGIPAEALWERVPGVTQDDVTRWKELAKEADPITSLAAQLERQVA